MSYRRAGDPSQRNGLLVLGGKFKLAAGLKNPGGIVFEKARVLIEADWAAQVDARGIDPKTIKNYVVDIASLIAYAISRGGRYLYEIDTNLLIDWITAVDAAGVVPAHNTMYRRRSAARAFFTSALRLGLYDVNPADPIKLSKRNDRYVGALTDGQIQQMRDCSPFAVGETKTPAMLALMTLGVQSTEVSHIRVGDVDFANRRVWVHSPIDRYLDRWVPLDDDWAYDALVKRIDYIRKHHIGHDPVDYVWLCYQPAENTHVMSTAGRQSSVAVALTKLMREARVYKAGETRVVSITEWAALTFYQRSDSLESVAQRLGVRSHDAVAHVVGYDWVAANAISAPIPFGGDTTGVTMQPPNRYGR